MNAKTTSRYRPRSIRTGLIVAGLALASGAQAATLVPEKEGVSGFVNLGVGGINVETNMVESIAGGHIDVGDSVINSLSNSPDDESAAVPVVDFELSYTFAKHRTQVYVGTLLEDYLSFDMFTQLGVRHDFGQAGIVSVAGLGSTGSKVWKDPYLENGRRQKTDSSNGGARFAWNHILNSPLNVNYQWHNIDMDHEQSGKALRLDRPDQKLLEREGDVHRFSAEYEFELHGKEHLITPGVRYIKQDLDGDAMARDGYGLYANYIYAPSGPWRWIVNASFSSLEADKSNPVYGKHDDNDRYGIAVSGFYQQPFGLKHWALNGTIAYYEDDHDVDFYDQSLTAVTIAMFRRF